eukprot:1188922-Prorocentrum_minimum.AAC.1
MTEKSRRAIELPDGGYDDDVGRARAALRALTSLACWTTSSTWATTWRSVLRRNSRRTAQNSSSRKGTPVGVVDKAQGPALGSWEDRRPPAAYVLILLLPALDSRGVPLVRGVVAATSDACVR